MAFVVITSMKPCDRDSGRSRDLDLGSRVVPGLGLGTGLAVRTCMRFSGWARLTGYIARYYFRFCGQSISL